MTSRAVGACARDLFGSFERGGIDIGTTRRRAVWWIQGLVDVWREDIATKFVTRAVAQARTKRNPAAWANWMMMQPGYVWLTDDEMSAMVAGPRRPVSEPGTEIGTLAEALALLHFS